MSVCGCEVVRGAVAPKGPMTYASLVSVIIKGMGLQVESNEGESVFPSQ